MGVFAIAKGREQQQPGGTTYFPKASSVSQGGVFAHMHLKYLWIFDGDCTEILRAAKPLYRSDTSATDLFL